MKCSLRTGLATLWMLILIISVSTGVIMIVLFRQGVGAQLKQAMASAEAACADIKHYADQHLTDSGEQLESVTADHLKRKLALLLEVVLSAFDGMEGGIWTPRGGFVAYAFPTYQGTSVPVVCTEARGCLDHD